MGNGVWYKPMTWDGPWGWVWVALFGIVFCRAGGTYLIGRAARSGMARFKLSKKSWLRPSTSGPNAPWIAGDHRLLSSLLSPSVFKPP